MATDPKLAKLLADAQDPEALARLELFEKLRACFRVTAAGVDVTAFRGPPLLEPELQKPKQAAKGKRRRRR